MRSTIFRMVVLLSILTVVVALRLSNPQNKLTSLPQGEKLLNGFDLSEASVPLEDILSGGPLADDIPSIDRPRFIPTAKVDYLLDDDIVIGLNLGKVARAYPLRILIWHEIVNDDVDGNAVAVTYCPLCGTSMVFDREIKNEILSFGVSGLLYQSDVLMYDRESMSLWSQLAMKAISGPSVGEPLNWLPSEHITWKAWKNANPDGMVLSTKTGHRRDYRTHEYDSYFASDFTMFPVPHTRKELKNKAWVIGIQLDGITKAYPVDAFPGNGLIQDTVQGRQLEIRFDANNRFPQVSGPSGETIPSVMVYWFAWQAFYPDTELWGPKHPLPL